VPTISSTGLSLAVEADFDWLANNSNSSNAVFVPGVGNLQFSANDRWMTTLAGRVGYAANNWLFYAKGGGGWVGVNNPTLTNLTTGGSISVSNSNSNSGWLATLYPLSVTRRWRACTQHNGGKSPGELVRDARAAWRRFKFCLAALPQDQAAAVWQQTVLAEATAQWLSLWPIE
jgi:hypothetical protein